MIYFIDTNIFLRTLIDENIQVYKECKVFLNSVKHNKLKAFTSDIILAEIVWTLKSFYKVSKPDIIKSLLSIQNLSGLKFTNEFDHALSIEIFKNYNVKYIDALIASHPQIYSKKATIISYDKDFDKIGVLRKEPSEIQ